MKKILAALLFLLPAAAQAQIVGALPFQLQNGTTADATQVMADFNKILGDVNTNAAKNGVNSDITALTALSTPLTPSQGGSPVYFASTSTGTANAQIVASPVPSGFSLAIGKRITFIAGFTNTGATQLNVNSSGLTNVFKPTPAGPIALTGGEIVAGNYIEAVYNGTQYELYTDATKQGYGPLTNIASAATTDIGTISSHNVNITGTTGITALGSTASTGWPIYKLTFAGVLTITHNGTSLILPGATGITTAANDTAEVVYLGSGNWRMTRYTRASGQYPINPSQVSGYINGLNLSTAGSSATYGITEGTATDTTNGSVMVLVGPYTKTTASWAVGSGNGSLDTGSIAINTWYHAFLIRRPDTNVTDILISLSATAPTMPANYTQFRRIGSMKTNGSSQWVLFTQSGDEFLWDLPVNDYSNVATPTGTITLASVPTGVSVTARMNLLLASTVTGANVLLYPGFGNAQTQGTPSGNATLWSQAATANAGAQANVMTNTSGQVRASSNGTGTITFVITTYGWRDTRGKL